MPWLETDPMEQAARPTTVRTGSVAQLLCAARTAHPDWGPVKLLDWLRARHPRVAWPAASTVGDLTREGLVSRRRRRHPHVHPGVVAPDTRARNDLWTADFKGQFPTQDGILCYPLTIADQHTRFLLTCHGVRSTHGVLARPVFERTVREFGLPLAIRTDNGVPFATPAIPGLSDLLPMFPVAQCNTAAGAMGPRSHAPRQRPPGALSRQALARHAALHSAQRSRV